MKFKMDFNLSVWMRDVEIEAENVEEAEEKLTMAMRRFLDKGDEYLDGGDVYLDGGYSDEYDITDLDITTTEKTYKVEVSNIIYDIDDEYAVDNSFNSVDALPSELTLNIEWEAGDDLEDLIADEITNKTDWLVRNFNYKIIE